MNEWVGGWVNEDINHLCVCVEFSDRVSHQVQREEKNILVRARLGLGLGLGL